MTKRLRLAVTLGALVWLSACGGGGGDTAPPAAPPAPTSATLTLIGGVGPASVPAQGQAEVWATVLPQNQIVTRWSGGSFVTDDEEWHATVSAGAGGPLTLTAERQTLQVVFETVAYSAPTARVKTARLHIPPSPRGLILMLHGTGGSSLFVERAESRYLALKAISKGYAVLSPEAEEVVAGDLDGDGKTRWEVPLATSNTDLRALDALLASLYAAGRLPAGLPQYALGMSNGGAMAVALGAVAHTAAGPGLFPRLRFNAVVSYCAQGSPDAVALTRTPTAWYLCANDENAAVSNSNAQAHSAALAARGVTTQLLLHAATPLFDERFMRVTGVDVALSRSIAAELRAAGCLDAAQMFTVSTADISARVQAQPAAFPVLSALSGVQAQAVLSQIAVMRAEHEMFSDWSSRTLRWFGGAP